MKFEEIISFPNATFHGEVREVAFLADDMNLAVSNFLIWIIRSVYQCFQTRLNLKFLSEGIRSTESKTIGRTIRILTILRINQEIFTSQTLCCSQRQVSVIES